MPKSIGGRLLNDIFAELVGSGLRLCAKCRKLILQNVEKRFGFASKSLPVLRATVFFMFPLIYEYRIFWGVAAICLVHCYYIKTINPLRVPLMQLSSGTKKSIGFQSLHPQKPSFLESQLPRCLIDFHVFFHMLSCLFHMFSYFFHMFSYVFLFFIIFGAG